MRIGHGFDAHRFEKGRRLVLGGVEIPSEMGLLGHSDADVLVHAVMDALLGALALGDIGKHFPDTDPKYKDADSIDMLKAVYKLLESNGYRVGNLDATIIAQIPRLSPYIEKMRRNIAAALQTDFNNISVKATTEERMGYTGRCEGISAHAICIIERADEK